MNTIDKNDTDSSYKTDAQISEISNYDEKINNILNKMNLSNGMDVNTLEYKKEKNAQNKKVGNNLMNQLEDFQNFLDESCSSMG